MKRIHFYLYIYRNFKKKSKFYIIFFFFAEEKILSFIFQTSFHKKCFSRFPFYFFLNKV
jgi:hypothetical protein